MKRRLLNKKLLKQTLLAVPAAALMLGAAQAGTTVGLNFNSFYYNTDGGNWATAGGTPAPAGFGWGYQTSGWPVTAKAFGVPAANWFNGRIFAWWTATPVDVNVPMGSLGAQCTAPAAIETGIGEQVAGWNPETVAPGNDEVTWNILQSNGGVSPSVVVTNLAATYPNGYVVQTITARRGTSAQFNGVGFTDTITSTHADYTTTYYRQNPASDTAVTGGTVGLSGLSGTFTGDTLNINCDAETSPSNSVLCGFIITDQPVVTATPPPVSVLLLPGGSFTLPPPATIIGIGLQYQWQHAGTNLLGATFASYTNNSAVTTDTGLYEAVVTSSYYPSFSATGQVANVTVIPPHAARTATWDANTGTTGAQDGSGTWSYGLPNWWDGSADDYWGAPDSAVFGMGGAGPYKVTLGDNITANGITFNSGGYTITNSSGQTLTLATNTTVTANAAATIGAPLSTGSNTFLKAGTGALTVSGALTCTNTTIVSAGTLEVRANSGDTPYVVTNGATLKIGYTTGAGYAKTALQLYGDGTAATTGLYLLGGKTYNVSGSLVVNNAPTAIRQYGSGLAGIGIFDINSNPGLSITAAASGSVIDANIQMLSRGYGMVVTTAAGANTATGDLVINGPLNVGSLGLYKRGGGSLRLNGAALPGNLALKVQAGTVTCGVSDCIGANAILNVSAGATLDLNGFNQTVTNATLAGTLKMTIKKGSTPNSDVLTVTDPLNTLSYGGDLVVTNVGSAPAIGDSFKLFNSPVSYGGGFTTVTLPALVSGQAWQNDVLTDGTIRVIAGSVPPTITTDLPATSYAYVGGSVSISVVAAGDPVLHYYWKKNGTTPVGTDSPTLTLSPATAADSGSYSVMVSNPYPPTAQSASCLVSVVTPSTVASASLTDSPLALWPLSETAGTTAFDYWAGHNGANAGSLPSSVAGPRPPAYQGFSSSTTAYQFDGASYVDCGTAPALSGTTDFTLEAWVNTTNTAGSYVLQQRSGYNGEYMLNLNGSGTVSFTIYGGGGYQVNALTSPRAARRVNDGAWHHIAAVRSGTSVVIYIDGSAVATATGTLVPLDPTFTVAIGWDARDKGTYFIGGICDVAIYSHALSAARIAAHASTGVLNTAPLKLNLVAGGWVEDTKPVGQPYDGMNLGASWVASSTDATPVTRTGVAQFGSGGQIAIPANADINSPSGTICFWMRSPLPPAGTGMMLVDRRTSAGLVLVLEGTPSGGLAVQYTGNASFVSGGYVVDDNWHQVTLTYDQSATGSVTVYVDGQNVGGQVNTAAWSWPTTQQIELARSHDPYWQEYNGQMDDFRIYNRILADTEIATIAAPATSDNLVDAAALKVRYNFGTAAGVGSQLSWQIGVLQGATALGSPTSWTPIGATSPSYPFLPPYAVTNAAMFYELKLY